MEKYGYFSVVNDETGEVIARHGLLGACVASVERFRGIGLICSLAADCEEGDERGELRPCNRVPRLLRLLGDDEVREILERQAPELVRAETRMKAQLHWDRNSFVSAPGWSLL